MRRFLRPRTFVPVLGLLAGLLGAAAPAHAAVNVTISDVSQAEGTGGTTNFNFNIQATNTDAMAPSVAGSVTVGTADGTAIAAGAQPNADYTAQSGVVVPIGVLPASGVANIPFTVVVGADNTFELTEQFFVNLTNGVNVNVTDAQGIGTIQNDDNRPSLVVADPAAHLEGTGANTVYNFVVALERPTYLDVSFNVSTLEGSATSAGSGPGTPDYTEILDQTFTIPAGSLNVNVPVTIIADAVDENNETFGIRITNLTQQLVAVNLLSGGIQQANGVITDDDAGPTVSISALVTELCETDNPVQITVSLSAASALPVTVAISTGGTATFGTDYTLAPTGNIVFAPGETMKQLTLDPTADGTVEPDETITVTATPGTNATGGAAVLATITLHDPDSRVVFLEKISGGNLISINGNPLQVFRATVTDGCGDPVPFAAVTFHVNGTTGSDQDVTVIANSQGEAQFSYTPLFPGTDDVTASVDNLGQTFTSNLISTNFTIGNNTPNAAVDGHGSTDAAEASGPTGLLAFFSLDVRNLRNNKTTGAVNVTLPVLGAITLRSLKVNHLIAGQGLPDGKKALIFGTAKLLVQVGGPGSGMGGIRTVQVPVSIRVDALDNGNPGVPNDRFEVTFLVNPIIPQVRRLIAAGVLPDGTFTAGGNVVAGKNGVPGNINIRNGLGVGF